MEKGVALLSGGIDSPVAIHLMQQRLEIIAVHFHQLPLTDGREIEKVKELCKILQVRKLYLVPFTPVLKALVEKCQHKDYYVLGKIMMMRCATLIAAQEDAQFLITGENLGQVSSQTLSNLTSITKNVSMEILRPLLTYDKQEIINVAKKIGTYETSKGPEICNLLGPKSPSTKSEPDRVRQDLEHVDADILQKALDDAEVVEF
ncbi:7-cyano-7-deazaguanine synthase [Candidatus Woesearchaeota archaeon]|nr:7-cyano-7-deazaguanine synthase [Candidatus Woesearchaeota archaeon]